MLHKQHRLDHARFRSHYDQSRPKLSDLAKMDPSDIQHYLSQAHKFFKASEPILIDDTEQQYQDLLGIHYYLAPVKPIENEVKTEEELDSASTQAGTDKDETAIKVEEKENEPENEDEKEIEVEDEEDEEKDRYTPKVDTKNLFGILRDRVVKLISEILEGNQLPKVVLKDTKKPLRGLHKRFSDAIFSQSPEIIRQFGSFLHDYMKDKEEYKNYEKCNKNQKWKKIAKDLDLDSTSFYNLMKRYLIDVEPKDYIEFVNRKEFDLGKLRDFHEQGGNEDLVDRVFYNWKNNKSRVKLAEFCQLPQFKEGALLFYKLVRLFMDQDDSLDEPMDKRMKDGITKKLLCPQFKKNFMKNIAKDLDKELKKSCII